MAAAFPTVSQLRSLLKESGSMMSMIWCEWLLCACASNLANILPGNCATLPNDCATVSGNCAILTGMSVLHITLWGVCVYNVLMYALYVCALCIGSCVLYALYLYGTVWLFCLVNCITCKK